jgi:hypothetical protein
MRRRTVATLRTESIFSGDAPSFLLHGSDRYPLQEYEIIIVDELTSAAKAALENRAVMARLKPCP